MVTVCAEGYIPAAGLKVGAAAGRVMVYTADLTWLAELPIIPMAVCALTAETAMALSVSVVDTLIGPA
jgi:hypothetical protein